MHFQFLFEAMSQPMKHYSMCRHHHLSLERKKKKNQVTTKKKFVISRTINFFFVRIRIQKFPTQSKPITSYINGSALPPMIINKLYYTIFKKTCFDVLKTKQKLQLRLVIHVY